MAGEILRKMSKVSHLYPDNVITVTHYVTRWFCSENLPSLIDLPMDSLNISICWITLFEKTQTKCDNYLLCILKNNFRLTSTCSLTFIPVSYECTMMSYIIEINKRSKQFYRIGNWKSATRLPAKFHLMLLLPCFISQKQIMMLYISFQEF